MDDERYTLTLKDASERLGKSVHTIRKWHRQGLLSSTMRSSVLYFDAAELDAIDKQKDSTPRGRFGPRAGDITAAQWAEKAGVSTRQAVREKAAGRISSYTPETAQQIRADKENERNTLNEAKRRKELALAELNELKLAEAKGHLYPAENVEAVVRQLAYAAKTELQNLAQVMPAKMAKLVQFDEEQARVRFEAEVRRICIEYAGAAVERLSDIATRDMERKD